MAIAGTFPLTPAIDESIFLATVEASLGKPCKRGEGDYKTNMEC